MLDYGSGVEHCGACHRPRCPGCRSCAQVSQGGGLVRRGVPAGTFRRRYICTGCGARLTLDYPAGGDSRRCAAQDAAFGIGRCDGCGTRTDHKHGGVICCTACAKARDRGFRDRRQQVEATFAGR